MRTGKKRGEKSGVEKLVKQLEEDLKGKPSLKGDSTLKGSLDEMPLGDGALQLDGADFLSGDGELSGEPEEWPEEDLVDEMMLADHALDILPDSYLNPLCDNNLKNNAGHTNPGYNSGGYRPAQEFYAPYLPAEEFSAVGAPVYELWFAENCLAALLPQDEPQYLVLEGGDSTTKLGQRYFHLLRRREFKSQELKSRALKGRGIKWYIHGPAIPGGAP